MEPPNTLPIDMRKTKLKPEEAALIAGEVVKPSWASRNEGIHERVSFEDTLWGFEMAGGKFYNTPLRVAYVRPGSRADHACIKMGDTVLRINGRETSDLTLQEAHQLVLEAGIDLKIVVTAPEDTVNAFYKYQDPTNETPGPTPEQLKEMELERVRKALERASRCRELPWPWVRKNWTIYRESNCHMVPSKYENQHRDKFPELPPEKLDFFYPAEKIKRGNKNKENAKHTTGIESNKITEEENNKKIDDLEENAEVEELENSENGALLEDSDERIDVQGAELHENDSKHLQNNSNSDSYFDEESNVSSQDPNQKASDADSVPNYEVDNNNNHVVKSKNDANNEGNEDTDSNTEDKVINEIEENSSNDLVDVKENGSISDDDILNSVLNENEDSKDSQNER